MRTSKRKKQLAYLHAIQDKRNQLLSMNQTKDIKFKITKIDLETDFILNQLDKKNR